MKKTIPFLLGAIFFVVAIALVIFFKSRNALETMPSKEILQEKYKDSTAYQYQEKEKSKTRLGRLFQDSVALPPIHLAQVYVVTSMIDDMQSISYDVEIKNEVPRNYSYYIALFSQSINGINFYAGIQTQSDGFKFPDGKMSKKIGKGAIFSRWYERSKEAVQTDGFYSSSEKEGDFISVRNRFNWGKGKYRVLIYKDKYIPGKTVTDTTDIKKLHFSFGEYEHTWVGMKAINLDTGEEVEVGKLAFPGKKLNTSNFNTIFVENYGNIIDYSSKKNRNFFLKKTNKMLNHEDVPKIDMVISNYRFNGVLADIVPFETFYNRQRRVEQDELMKLPRTADVEVVISDSSQIKITTGPIFPFKENDKYYKEVIDENGKTSYQITLELPVKKENK